MPLDGILLYKLSNELKFLETGRINKINQVSDTDFLFTLRANRTNFNLFVSLDKQYPRVNLTNKNYTPVNPPKRFTTFLRKRIGGMFVKEIKTMNMDRVLLIKFSGLNEIKDQVETNLYIEIMGRQANMILTSEDNVIIEVLHHKGISENSRSILPKAIYELPENNKLNLLELSDEEINSNALKITEPSDISSLYSGVSYPLANYIFEKNMFDKDIKNIFLSYDPVIYKNNKDKLDFYFFPLKNEVLHHVENISTLVEEIYFDRSKLLQIKNQTNDINLFVNKMINKLHLKMSNLRTDLGKTDNKEKYRLYGELLLQESHNKVKSESITLLNYYDNTLVTIPLDVRFDITKNSNFYYRKYTKLKNAVVHLEEQLKETSEEIDYFNLLKAQIAIGDISSILEIKQELIQNKYLNITKNSSKKQRKQKPLSYLVDDTEIIVGKNNIQNDYITNKIAKPNEVWFHVKDAPGSHVLVRHPFPLSENIIRTAAHIAAYYSTFRMSGTVPVDYTEKRNVKKVPGRHGCFVTMKTFKTIYIDPDKNFIDTLEVLK